MSTKTKFEEMSQNKVYDFMNKSICYALDGDGELNQMALVKVGYDEFGGSLETLKDYAHRINEIYEGRGRELNERQ